ncbi:uncharacterized protein LOC105902739 [Clupea harengus]|uniref:Uncharacterized protein LOC105902739 n=1 Tax=Clupea harengus TaxID=7950 RepID=A0A8M1KYM7_CLUHA|nr:uncharacterized protein LOC105902739 [Clupea harengus]
MHLLSMLSLLVMGLASTTGYEDDRDMFSLPTKSVCPGKSFINRRPTAFRVSDLYFKSSVPGSSEILVANKTMVFLPFYQLKDNAVFIPEVMKHHEGEYFWKVPIRVRRIELIVKDCAVPLEVNYGEKVSLVVPKEASMLEFTTPKSSDRWVLWSRINTDNTRGARGTVGSDLWVALKITQADAGRYTFLRESGGEISSTALLVKELQRYPDLSDESIHHHWENRFPVPVSEAVLTFIDSDKVKHVLFKNGMETEEAFRMFGTRIELQAIELGELTLTIVDLNSRDTGRYEVHDKNKDLAVVIWLSGSSDSGYPSRELAVPIGTAIVISILVFCCCREIKWCCKKSNAPVTSGSGQPVYVHDPVLSELGYRLQPQPTAPSAERQSWLQPPSSAHPWDSDPPSYDDLVGPEYCYPYTPAAPPPEAPVEGGEGGKGAPPSPPQYPLDPGPQYQPRGWGGGLDDFLTSSPLSMDTNTDTYVYNSDKLN